jgi:hypothetical protein
MSVLLIQSFRKPCDQVVFFRTLLQGSSMADLLARQGVQRSSGFVVRL